MNVNQTATATLTLLEWGRIIATLNASDPLRVHTSELIQKIDVQVRAQIQETPSPCCGGAPKKEEDKKP